MQTDLRRPRPMTRQRFSRSPPPPPVTSQWLAANERLCMTLPRELRDQIYPYFVPCSWTFDACSDTESPVDSINHLYYWTGIKNKCVGTFAQHRVIHREALAYFYSNNTFTFYSQAHFMHWMTIIGPDCAAELRTVRMSIEGIFSETAIADDSCVLARSLAEIQLWHKFVSGIKTSLPNLDRLEFTDELGDKHLSVSNPSLVFHSHLGVCASLWRALGTHPSLAEISFFKRHEPYPDDCIEAICRLTGCEVRTYETWCSGWLDDEDSMELSQHFKLVDNEVIVLY